MGFFGKSDPESATVRGKPVPLPGLWQRDVLATPCAAAPAVATFFDLEWTAPTCTCLICSACGYVHWFFPQD